MLLKLQSLKTDLLSHFYIFILFWTIAIFQITHNQLNVIIDQLLSLYWYCNCDILNPNSMQQLMNKQRVFPLSNGIEFSSNFQSGNLSAVLQKEQATYHLWVEGDPNSSYRTWFYFTVEGIQIGVTVTFCIVNLSNQVKLFREGHLPVFRSQEQKRWNRIKQPIAQNGISKGEEGFQLTFKHTFNSKTRHQFAFSFPWTYTENNLMFRGFADRFKERYFCQYQRLCQTTKKLDLNIFTVTKPREKDHVEIKEFSNLQNFEAFTFPEKRGIFISARVHPGEVASSHMLNGLMKYLFSHSQQAQMLLQYFVFYIVPMVNPDGVVDGNFRCDSYGRNLNRFYTDPSPTEQPEIFSIKMFLIEMIRAKLIHFCLDLHAHVNKQGVFMYGNSTGSLRDQVSVCLFPKLMEYNCKFFDYGSCNFSEKNMSSKDKGDDLSKEGAARVSIYKETGLVSCWTLQCNYNSSKVINLLPKAEEQAGSKSISNGVLADPNFPNKKEELTFMNISEFEEIGANISETFLDYYGLRTISRCFGGRLKNTVNINLSLAINILRMIPFRFDNDCRKLINSINSGQCINENYGKILEILGLDPLGQYLGSRALKEKSLSKQKEKKEDSAKSLKAIIEKQDSRGSFGRQKRPLKMKSVAEKQKVPVPMKKIVMLVPTIPRVPKKG